MNPAIICFKWLISSLHSHHVFDGSMFFCYKERINTYKRGNDKKCFQWFLLIFVLERMYFMCYYDETNAVISPVAHAHEQPGEIHNLISEVKIIGQICKQYHLILLDCPNIKFTAGTFSFSFSSLISFVFLFFSLVFFFACVC